MSEEIDRDRDRDNWPFMTEEEREKRAQELQAELQDPATSPERIRAIEEEWPGIGLEWGPEPED